MIELEAKVLVAVSRAQSPAYRLGGLTRHQCRTWVNRTIDQAEIDGAVDALVEVGLLEEVGDHYRTVRLRRDA